MNKRWIFIMFKSTLQRLLTDIRNFELFFGIIGNCMTKLMRISSSICLRTHVYLEAFRRKRFQGASCYNISHVHQGVLIKLIFIVNVMSKKYVITSFYLAYSSAYSVNSFSIGLYAKHGNNAPTWLDGTVLDYIGFTFFPAFHELRRCFVYYTPHTNIHSIPCEGKRSFICKKVAGQFQIHKTVSTP